MRLHLSVRTLFYSVAAVAVAALAILALTVYLHGLNVPEAVLNSRTAQSIAARYGVHFSLESLQLGCLRRNCPGTVNAGALEIDILTPDPFQIHLNETHWRRAGPLTAGDLEIRSGNRPPAIAIDSFQVDPVAIHGVATGLRVGLLSNAAPAEIGSLEFDGTAKRVTARGIRIQGDQRPPVEVNEVQLEGWKNSPSDGWIVLDRLNLTGVNLVLVRSAASSRICDQLPAAAAVGRQAIAPFLPLLPFLRESFLKLQGDLLRVALAFGIVILILKFLSVLCFRRWLVRLLLAVIPAVAPFALYFGLRDTFATGRLVMVAGGVMAALAVLLRIFVYRRGARWYQRWEPFAVDIAAVVVLLPLLGYGFVFPALPAAPAGMRLDRIDVADIAAQSSDVQFRVRQTSILGVKFALPGSAGSSAELGIASIEVPATNVSSPALSRLTLDNMRIDGVSAVYDPDRMEVRGISAHLRLGGVIESNGIEREIQNIEFLRGMNRPVNRVAFDVEVQASGPDVTPQILPQFAESHNPIAVNAAVMLRPAECTASYDLAARILTAPLNLTVWVDGDAQHVNIRTMRTAPESPLQIGGGSGTILVSGSPKIDLNLQTVGGTFGSTQLDVNSIGISAAFSPPGRPGYQAVSMDLGPTRIRSSEGMEIRVGKANVSFDRTADPVRVPLSLETHIENVRFESRGSGLIEANFPYLTARIAGQTTAERIPRSFNGTVDFHAYGSNPGDEIIGTDRPLSINTDLWKGLLDVPEQQVKLGDIPLQFKLSGRLSAIFPQLSADIETAAALAHFEQNLGSARLALDEARISGRANWNDGGSSASLNYATGWTSLGLPPGPTAACLDEVSTLDLTAAGKISRLTPPGSFSPAAGQAPSTCLAFPSIPGSIRFQLSGTYPPGPQESAIRLEREDGTGIRIRNFGTTLQNLQLRDGRLVSVESLVNVAGIQNLEGLGGVDVQARIRQTQGLLQLDSELSAPDGILLVETAVASTPAKITVDATQHVPADRMLSQVKPFLSDLNFDLGDVNPQARLTQMHAEANFESGALLDANASIQLDGGAIGSSDSADLQFHVTAPGSVGPALDLFVEHSPEPNGPFRVVAKVHVPSVSIHARTRENGDIDVDANLNGEARARIFMSGTPPASPVLDKAFQVSSGLSRHASNIAEVFGTDRAPQPVNNISWSVHLSESSPLEPVLRFAPDVLQVRIAGASFDAAWDGDNGQNRSAISGRIALDTTIRDAGDPLVVDALVPIALNYTRDGQPDSRIESNLPIQLLFAKNLKESQTKADSLWDQDYYAQFWREHPSRFSNTDFSSPIDLAEVTLGPLSVQQIRFPLEPLRVVIGYSDALQLGVPFSGRALFGGVEGKLESRLTTSKSAASLDTRLHLDLKNIQAGAIATTMNGAHSAILEDELDGSMSLHLDGVTMDRNTLPALLAGRMTAEELGKVGMSAHLFRSPEAANLPGVLQASSDVQINLVNEVLNQIVKDLRLPAPPRALTYSNLALDFDVERGMVRTNHELLKLGGLQVFSSNFVDVNGEIRAHLGRPGERIMLGDLMELLGGITAATDTGDR